MTQLTHAQQLEISEFFLSHAQGRRDNIDGEDSDLDEMFEADAKICDKLATVTFADPIELYKTIRREFDDYADVFAAMEEHSNELHKILDTVY